MKKCDIVVVGGGPAGFNAVKSIRSIAPDKTLLVVTDREDLQIPCSIPYVVSGKVPLKKNRYPIGKLKDLGAELKVSRVTSINPSESVVFLDSGEAVSYNRLILATGWVPNLLNVPGSSLEGIYYIGTDTEHVAKMREAVVGARRLVIVGAGFISLGFVDQIVRAFPDKDVTVVEASDRVASATFCERFESEIVSSLQEWGVKLILNAKVSGFEGNGSVKKVKLDTGDCLEADVVFVFIGFKPNTKVAVDAGIEVDSRGAIVVDDFLRTSVDNVLAAGNCMRHISAIDGLTVSGMFASVAARDGRIAGINATGPKVSCDGIVPAGITEVGGTFYGFAGYSEKFLKENGFDFVAVDVPSWDAYPSAMPGASNVWARFYFLKVSGKLVGGEVSARSRYVTAFVELVSRLILGRKRAVDIVSDVSVAFPPVTPPPLVQPVVDAAVKVLPLL